MGDICIPPPITLAKMDESENPHFMHILGIIILIYAKLCQKGVKQYICLPILNNLYLCMDVKFLTRVWG
jgi:hypothetical protein